MGEGGRDIGGADSRGHDTHCIIGRVMNGLDALIFRNVYHVPATKAH
jgi:hypothetical protein